MLLAYIVAGLAVTLLASAAAWFWKQCFGNPDPAGVRSSVDGALQGQPTDARWPGTPKDQPADAPLPPDGTPKEQPTNTRLPPDGTPKEQPADTPVPPDGTPKGQPADTPVPPDGTPKEQPAETPVPPDGTPKEQPADTPVPPDGTPKEQPAETPVPPDGTPKGQPADTPVPPDGTPKEQPTDTRLPPDGTPKEQPADTPVPPDETPKEQPADTPVPPDGIPKEQPAETPVPPDGTPKEQPAETPVPPDGTPKEQPADTPVPPDGTPQEQPAETPVPPDGTPQGQEETAAPAAPLGVRWSWRRHRPSGLQFLRVIVANAGPNAAAVTRVRLKMSAKLTDHADPPADLLEASDYAAELFGPDTGGVPLPRTIEPGGSTEAYFPSRDVADWLYGVAESDNLDRNECHLAPECVDATGVSHPAKRKVDYETWLRHGHGPSLQQYADGRDPQSAGDHD